MWNDGDDEKLYFVAESKSTLFGSGRRGTENAKIKCGKAHFEAIGTEMIAVVDIADVETHVLDSMRT